MSDPRLPGVGAIREAAARIAPFAHRTAVFSSRTMNDWLGVELFAKAENLQRVGAFKFRGACNAVLSLTPEEAARGVCTHSSGNHAQALALAAHLRGAAAHVVMPRTAPPVKRAAVAEYGARIIPCEPCLAAREAALAEVRSATGAVFIHPYNDSRVIAGQGTAALELLAEVPALEILLVPVGGGGLLSGTAIAAASLAPDCRVYGAEPAGADDAARSLQEGRILPSVDPLTMADGLLTSLGELTFSAIQAHAAGILTVSEDAIAVAMRRVWERMKLVIEPSAAVPVAALLEHGEQFRGARVGVILSGGNVDLDRLPWSPG